MIRAFLLDETGQGYVEYTLLVGAAAIVFVAVGVRFRNELISTFEFVIQTLQGARR